MSGIDRREKRREAIDLRVTVQVSAGGRAWSGQSSDLSIAGVFVRSSELLPVGDRVDLVLEPEEGGVILLAGEVAHAEPGKGLGISFHKPGAIAGERLAALLAARAGHAPKRRG